MEKFQKISRKKTYPKILLYTSHPFIFRSTVIGNLYEITQVYPVILLSEKLDSETEKILKDKRLFPKLQEIVRVRQHTEQKMNLLAKNRYFYKLAKNLIEQYKPNIVITTNDRYPFELYLLRFAKKAKAINICFQSALQTAEMTQQVLRSNLANAYLNTPSFLPFFLRIILVKCKKQLAHFLYYWALPLMMRQLPFLGESSFILYETKAKLRDADFYVLLSKRDYDLCSKDGASPEKLYILPHPLKRKTPRRFLEKAYLINRPVKQKTTNKISTLLLSPTETGIRIEERGYSLISEEETKRQRIRIVSLLTQILSDWQIFIKPHPEIKDIGEKREFFESISKLVKVTHPSEPVEKYIGTSDLILDIPPVSTALFTASLQCPDKVILSLDLAHELLGDSFKDFEGIRYIDNEKEFIETLELIRDNKYPINRTCQRKNEEKLEPNEFSSAIEALDYFILAARKPRPKESGNESRRKNLPQRGYPAPLRRGSS